MRTHRRPGWAPTRHSVELGGGGVTGAWARPSMRYGRRICWAGDCAAGQQSAWLAITAWDAWGRPGRFRRAMDGPGDRLISTGPHGLSRLGLAVLGPGPLRPSLPASLLGAGPGGPPAPPSPAFDAVERLGRRQAAPLTPGGCPEPEAVMLAAAVPRRLPAAALANASSTQRCPARWPPEWNGLPRPKACVWGS